MQQLSTKKSGAVYSLISAHEFSQKSKKLLYKSINLALKNTKKSEHSKFLDVHSVNILTLLLNHFNKEESAKAFSQISALKQREKSPSYPKPKKESWVEIYSQAKECLLCLDKNIRIAYHLKIESKQYFIPISSNSNESFFSRDLICKTGEKFQIIMPMNPPFVPSFYLDGKPHSGKNPPLEKKEKKRFHKLLQFIDESKIGLDEFLESLQYRIQESIGDYTGKYPKHGGL